MKSKTMTLLVLSLALYILLNPLPIQADRKKQSWNDLLELSEFIGSARLTAMREDSASRKNFFHFEVREVFKGDNNKIVDLYTIEGSEDQAEIKERGKYILFLRREQFGAVQRNGIFAENAMKEQTLISPDEEMISAINESSYEMLTGIPKEIFSKRRIGFGMYGKRWIQTASVIEFASLENWLRNHFKNRPNR